MTAHYDDRTVMLMITKSPSGFGPTFKPMSHLLMKLVKVEGNPVLQEVYSFDGTTMYFPAETRATQIIVPDGIVVVNYRQDSKMMQARSPNVGLFDEISVDDNVSDLCTIYSGSTHFLAALSECRCSIFSLQLTN